MKHTIYKSFGTFAATASLLTTSSIAGTEPAPAPAPAIQHAPGSILDEIAGNLHVSYANMYEFRFVDRGNDLVSVGLDLAYDAGIVNITGGAWYGTWDAASTGLINNQEELDLYAGVSYDVTEDFSLEVGHISYIFFDGSGDTNEIYVSGTYQLPYNLAVESTYFWDYDTADGWYWDTNVSYSRELMESVALELSAGVAVNGGNNRQASTSGVGDEDGIQGYYLGASLPWTVRENVTLAPYIRYTDAESGLATNLAGTEAGGEHIIAGATLSIAF